MKKNKTPTSYDRYLGLESFSEGRCTDAWRYFGAHPRWDGQDGFFFRVWAPNAWRVSVFGPFNNWDPTANDLNSSPSAAAVKVAVSPTRPT